jgi:hypothetical protein
LKTAPRKGKLFYDSQGKIIISEILWRRMQMKRLLCVGLLLLLAVGVGQSAERRVLFEGVTNWT